MKILKTRLIWILLAIGIAMVSCKKDNVAEVSSFTFRDTVYTTEHGYITKVSSTETKSSYFIFLCSSDLNLVENKFVGKGPLVYILISSDSPDEIIPGLYVYDVNLNGIVYFNYDSENLPGLPYPFDPVLSSTAYIKYVDGVYDIEYKLTLATEEVLKGNFKGSLENFTFSITKMSKLYSFE